MTPLPAPPQSESILMISTHGYVGAEPELGKPDTGGQVVFVLELAKRFARLGYKVDVVTRQFEDQPEEDRVNKNLRVWRIPFGGKAFIRKEDMHEHIGDFITNFLLRVKADGLHYDVVNSHYWDAGWAGQRIAEELRIPHIHTPHSLGWWKQQEMKGARREQDKIYRFKERIEKEFLIYRNCDHIIATTSQQQEILHEEYGLPAEHVRIIPPGMDEGRYTPVQPARLKEIRAALGIGEKDIYCVGRAATNKGIDLLIAALPQTRKISPETKLHLAIGANSDRDVERIDSWKKLAGEVGVTDAVRWLGYIEDDSMADHYRAGGVFALPSRYEPFGMTAIEAMACGTPSIITTYGGLHDNIEFGRHALYADPKQPEEFGAMLAMPLRHERLHDRLSLEGARFARREYGWTGIAKRTLALFDHYKGRYVQEDREDLVAV